MTNEDCAQALKDLDNCDSDVTDWEAKFISSNLGNSWFSDRQHEIIQDMVEKYGV